MFTYLSTAPNSSTRSTVRLLIGDTNDEDQLLQDEELDAFLTMYPGTYRAAAEAAYAVAASYARQADRSAGSMSISLSAVAANFEKLANRLKSRGDILAVPYSGGLSLSDKGIDRADTDLVQHQFRLGMHDLPGGGTNLIGSSS